jgi:hypothetical protein
LSSGSTGIADIESQSVKRDLNSVKRDLISAAQRIPLSSGSTGIADSQSVKRDLNSVKRDLIPSVRGSFFILAAVVHSFVSLAGVHSFF